MMIVFPGFRFSQPPRNVGRGLRIVAAALLASLAACAGDEPAPLSASQTPAALNPGMTAIASAPPSRAVETAALETPAAAPRVAPRPPAKPPSTLPAAASAASTAESAAAATLEERGFRAWLAAFRTEAEGQGVSRATLAAALDQARLQPRVLELDRAQPERRLTFAEYRQRVLNEQRVRDGRAMYARHRALLDEVGRIYGVQPRFIVALWGLETSYGRNTGGFDVIDALATLAYEGRRADFFRGELLKALMIIDQGHIGAKEMRGSWAGAMGQNQFMPSSFVNFAVDHDRDGRTDIWQSLPDVFASAANYLAKAGWNGAETWGRPVQVPRGIAPETTGLDVKKSLQEWTALGVRAADGGPLPVIDRQASLVFPGATPENRTAGEAYLVYDNYRVIMRWNRSTFFATTVGILADRIGEGT
jgi:membrane-bound lytic murein transglycosylase B